jgi:methylenetetrahydrofolate dehydrogenase (NADP+)/methenyltetrahydrofolate cyclohydrolase
MILRLSASNIKQTTMQLLDGKKQQRRYQRQIAVEVKNERQRRESSPFSSLIVGNDGASLTYVGSKIERVLNLH